MSDMEDDCIVMKRKGKWMYYTSTRCIADINHKNEFGYICKNTARCHKCFVR